MTILTGKHTVSEGLSVSLKDDNIDGLLEKEWLLTNSRGGFACSTVLGCNTRRYHSLLTGSLQPPAERITALSCCRETIKINSSEIEIGNFEFDGNLSLGGFDYMTDFSRDLGVHFDYTFDHAILRKSIYLADDSDTAAIVYDFSEVDKKFDFSVRPFTPMCDFHSLCKSDAHFQAVCTNNSVTIQDQRVSCQLTLQCQQSTFRRHPQWWYNFLYRNDMERKQEYLEDLWSPGIFNCHIDGPIQIVLWADFGSAEPIDQCLEFDLDTIIDNLKLKAKELAGAIKIDDKTMNLLCTAAGDFVVKRVIDEKITTIVNHGLSQNCAEQKTPILQSIWRSARHKMAC